MEKCPNELRVKPAVLRPVIEKFIRERVEKAGLTGVVVGISGGVDSAVAAGLAAAALGPANVMGLWLPYHDEGDRDDAVTVIEHFDIKSRKVSIAPMVDAYLPQASRLDDVRRGNVCARARMVVLYDYSKPNNALVMGTGNKSEALLGYFTLYGDGGCSLAPLADVYKGQVYILAEALGLPKKIINKKPSAGLWPGQTDEGELGVTYRELDRYLYYLVEKGEAPAKLVRRGFKPAFQKRVLSLINANLFKRQVPYVAKVTGKTVARAIKIPESF